MKGGARFKKKDIIHSFKIPRVAKVGGIFPDYQLGWRTIRKPVQTKWSGKTFFGYPNNRVQIEAENGKRDRDTRNGRPGKLDPIVDKGEEKMGCRSSRRREEGSTLCFPATLYKSAPRLVRFGKALRTWRFLMGTQISRECPVTLLFFAQVVQLNAGREKRVHEMTMVRPDWILTRTQRFDCVSPFRGKVEM